MVVKFIGGFFQFAHRVLDSARKGGLKDPDVKKLDNLLTRTGKRNTILAKGILTSLSAGGASAKDISRFGQLIQAAEGRISSNREPFTRNERDEIFDIFKRSYLSTKTARWFSTQVDELLAEEINEFISGSRRVDMGIPSKKSVKFARSEVHENERENPKRKLRN